MLSIFVPDIFYENVGSLKQKTPREWTSEHYDCSEKLMLEMININTGERRILYICTECGAVSRGDNLMESEIK